MFSESKSARRKSRRKQVRRGIGGGVSPPLGIVSFLAPNLLWFYGYVARYLEKRVAYPTKFLVGTDYAQLAGVDIAFVCGLPYVEHTLFTGGGLEPLAAPVPLGERYQGRPIYFSDVIVHSESPFRTFRDLRGYSWAYNEPHSQSGYGIVRHELIQKGETFDYFGRMIETGYHERSVQMVCSGEVDASAIDSHVLSLLMRDDARLATELRVIDTFGPSTIQPIVAGKHLPAGLKREIKAALLEMSEDKSANAFLARAQIERFVSVFDSDYDDIRRMLA